MTIKAGIEVDWTHAALRCIVFERVPGNGVRFVGSGDEFGDLRWRFQTEEESSATAASLGFTIPEDAALALLDALLNHFRGGHDARQLRADYDAERARVDRLMDAILPPRGTR